MFTSATRTSVRSARDGGPMETMAPRSARRAGRTGHSIAAGAPSRSASAQAFGQLAHTMAPSEALPVTQAPRAAATEDAVLRASNEPDCRDRSSTDRHCAWVVPAPNYGAVLLMEACLFRRACRPLASPAARAAVRGGRGSGRSAGPARAQPGVCVAAAARSGASHARPDTGRRVAGPLGQSPAGP